MAETANVKSASRPPVTPMRLVVITMLLAGALYVRFAPTRRIPSHFNTPDELKIVWSKPVRSQAISMRFSHDGKYLISSGGELKGKISRYKNREYLFDFKMSDKHLRLWDVAKRKQIEKLKAEAIFGGWNGEHMFIMPDFQTLITGGHYSDLKVVDIRKRRPDKIIRTHTGTVSSLEVSPDQKTLAIGTIGGVEFFEARTLRLLKTYEHYGGNWGASVYFSQDSRIAKCLYGGSRIPHYLSVKTGKRVSKPRSPDDYGRKYSPDKKYFLAAKSENQFELWRRGAKQNFKIKTYKTALLQIYSWQFSPDGRTFAVGGLSSTSKPIQFFTLPKTK